MKLRSWDRFKTRALTVAPDVMGRVVSFTHDGTLVTICIPPLDSVSGVRDESARATAGSCNAATGEPLCFDVNAVDVWTAIKSEVELPDGVLSRPPNAFDLIDDTVQRDLNASCEGASSTASSAFEYWLSIVRWVTGFHRVGREERVGFESGWSTYLHDEATGKPVWARGFRMVIGAEQVLSTNDWEQLVDHASAGRTPPVHITLLQDAKHCIDVGDYRRALVDLSVACEVYLRNEVLRSLPSGVIDEVARLVEEANINQHLSHMFPALLSDAAQHDYRKAIKEDLSSLFARRNKLMHIATVEGASLQSCSRYQRALERLFQLERRT